MPACNWLAQHPPVHDAAQGSDVEEGHGGPQQPGQHAGVQPVCRCQGAPLEEELGGQGEQDLRGGPGALCGQMSVFGLAQMAGAGALEQGA